MEILTVAQHAAADRSAASAGAPLDQLMDEAGRAIASATMRRWAPRPTIVLCGPGDNGGDGYVAARVLREAGWPVRVAALAQSETASPAASAARARWSEEAVPPTSAELGEAGLVIDALFGAGLSRPLSGLAAECAERAGAGGAVVVAADLPSGIAGDAGRALGPAFRADLTVTFLRKKPAHLLEPARSLCGEVALADIGHPPECLAAALADAPPLFENSPRLWMTAMPRPDARSHKHGRGRMLVVSGGPASTGAARLAARAGLRSGARRQRARLGWRLGPAFAPAPVS